MTTAAIAALLAACLVTSTVSGVFGMAGGLMLMGMLALLLPVSAAFVTHGLIQLVANGWRAVLHRRHIGWHIVGFYAAGALVAAVVVAGVAFAPSKPLLYLLLGLVPALVWLPGHVVRLDAARPRHAVAAGLSVTGLNLLAGVAGPLLDVFFVRTGLARHRIVATKAATQVLSHLAKTLVYGLPLAGAARGDLPPAWVLALAIPCSITGTVLGARVLDRLTDQSFLAWTRWIVTAIGAVYLLQAARLA